MAFINDIVIDIRNGARGLTQKSFRPIIVKSGSGVGFDKYIITELTDLVDAGISTSSDIYLMASAMLAQSPRPEDVMVVIGSGTLGETLDTALATDDNFYGITIPERTKVAGQAAGDFALANKKMFFGSSSDLTILDSRNNKREAYLLHSDPTDYPEAAWVGQNLPKQPGSATWKWKVLDGQVESGFSSTQLNTIRTNNGNALQEQKGQVFTNEGITTSGDYIDTTIGTDWVEDQLNIELLSLFINNDKISLDNTGIERVAAVVRSALKRAGDAGIIARATTESEFKKSDDKFYMYQVFSPKREDLATNDIATRTLRGISFVYYLAGAIHEARISGLITV
jgi:hypothetical protein